MTSSWLSFFYPYSRFLEHLFGGRRKEERRKQEEIAVRECEERLILGLDVSGLGVWDWNIQTGSVFYSTNWVTALGYKPEDVPPTKEFWKKIVHPEDWPKVTAALSEHAGGNRPPL